MTKTAETIERLLPYMELPNDQMISKFYSDFDQMDPKEIKELNYFRQHLMIGLDYAKQMGPNRLYMSLVVLFLIMLFGDISQNSQWGFWLSLITSGTLIVIQLHLILSSLSESLRAVYLLEMISVLRPAEIYSNGTSLDAAKFIYKDFKKRKVGLDKAVMIIVALTLIGFSLFLASRYF